MNPIHLIWIIPLSAIAGGIAGFIIALLLMLADMDDEEKEYSGLLEED